MNPSPIIHSQPADYQLTIWQNQKKKKNRYQYSVEIWEEPRLEKPIILRPQKGIGILQKEFPFTYLCWEREREIVSDSDSWWGDCRVRAIKKRVRVIDGRERQRVEKVKQKLLRERERERVDRRGQSMNEIGWLFRNFGRSIAEERTVKDASMSQSKSTSEESDTLSPSRTPS